MSLHYKYISLTSLQRNNRKVINVVSFHLATKNRDCGPKIVITVAHRMDFIHCLMKTQSLGKQFLRARKEPPFLQIQEGISVCDRSNGHLIVDIIHNARYNVHDSNTLAYRQREDSSTSAEGSIHSVDTSVQFKQ
jgi:hypothetical protein